MTAINWKEVSQSDGYKSLKAAYVHDVRRYGNSTHDYKKHFNWVIGRAKHYAHKLNKTVIEVLDEWEKKRDYWWMNFYQDSNQPKLHSNAIKPRGIKTSVKYARSWGGTDREKSIRARSAKISEQQRLAKKNPKRWSNEKKAKQRIRRSL